jgi:AraC-like DNA-binding protein
LGLLITAIPILIWQQNEYVNSLLEPLVIDTIVLYLFIKSILQTGLFMQTGVEMLKSTDHTLKIADEVVDNYLEILFSAMEKDKVYLKEGCTMEDVVANTGIPKHHLSFILNTNLQKSFADFINEYRIRHACLLLTSNKHQHLTLEALGHECGFGSKTSFNRAFKKHARQTPSAFQIANKKTDK